MLFPLKSIFGASILIPYADFFLVLSRHLLALLDHALLSACPLLTLSFYLGWIELSLQEADETDVFFGQVDWALAAVGEGKRIALSLRLLDRWRFFPDFALQTLKQACLQAEVGAQSFGWRLFLALLPHESIQHKQSPVDTALALDYLLRHFF